MNYWRADAADTDDPSNRVLVHGIQQVLRAFGEQRDVLEGHTGPQAADHRVLPRHRGIHVQRLQDVAHDHVQVGIRDRHFRRIANECADLMPLSQALLEDLLTGGPGCSDEK